MAGLLTFAASQGAWFAAVVGAAHGLPWIGPVLVGAWVAFALTRSSAPRRKALVLLLAGLFGYLADSALVLGGKLAFPPQSGLGGPDSLWMVSLWVSFALTLEGAPARLLRRTWLAVLLGGVAGPIAYASGVKLGAAELPAADSALFVGLVWAVAMPVLALLARKGAPPELGLESA